MELAPRERVASGQILAIRGKTLARTRFCPHLTGSFLDAWISARAMMAAGNAGAMPDCPAALAREIVDGGLSVREAEALTQQRIAPERKSLQRPSAARDSDTLALEKRLSDVLGLAVAITHSDAGGKLEIRYKTLEQLDGVCLKLTGYTN